MKMYQWKEQCSKIGSSQVIETINNILNTNYTKGYYEWERLVKSQGSVLWPPSLHRVSVVNPRWGIWPHESTKLVRCVSNSHFKVPWRSHPIVSKVSMLFGLTCTSSSIPIEKLTSWLLGSYRSLFLLRYQLKNTYAKDGK